MHNWTCINGQRTKTSTDNIFYHCVHSKSASTEVSYNYVYINFVLSLTRYQVLTSLGKQAFEDKIGKGLLLDNGISPFPNMFSRCYAFKDNPTFDFFPEIVWIWTSLPKSYCDISMWDCSKSYIHTFRLHMHRKIHSFQVKAFQLELQLPGNEVSLRKLPA